MLAYSDGAKEIAKDEKLYLFRFELKGKGVPETLITGEVASECNQEFAGTLTRKQYKAFIRFYLNYLCGDNADHAGHKKYVGRMTKKQEKQKASKKRGK